MLKTLFNFFVFVLIEVMFVVVADADNAICYMCYQTERHLKFQTLQL